MSKARRYSCFRYASSLLRLAISILIAPQEDDPDDHRLAITTLEGYLIGASLLSIGEASGAITGWIARDLWRNGYGREAAGGLVTEAFVRFPALEQLECGVMHDNEGAIRILEEIGFEWTGENVAKSPTRDEETVEYVYSVLRSAFEGAA